MHVDVAAGVGVLRAGADIFGGHCGGGVLFVARENAAEAAGRDDGDGRLSGEVGDLWRADAAAEDDDNADGDGDGNGEYEYVFVEVSGGGCWWDSFVEEF